MLMPMVWFNDDFDDLMDDVYDPFDDMISLVDEAPTKEEVETEKSIGRHLKKEGKKYERALRRSYNHMNQLMKKNAMRTDVVDAGDHYTVKADLPGFDKNDINIGLENGILTVTASHEENNDKKDGKSGRYLRRERTASSYQRAFNVGEDVKPEEIGAKYENGVLTLTIPHKAAEVTEKDEKKRIEIQ